MKLATASALALVLSAGVGLANQSDRSAFLPLEGQDIMPVAAVDRATADQPELGQIALDAAGLADVDANGDGKISFEELLKHDLEPGF